MDTFTWSPLIGTQGTGTLRVLSAQFGDGYMQSVADGINNEVQSWPLQFRGDATYIMPILTFIRQHAGYKSFLWTPPLDIERAFKVASYDLTAIQADRYTLAVTLQQDFKP
jgi:phage-related protein